MIQTEALRFPDLTVEPLSLRPVEAREIVVEVAASALNRADLLQRRGLYPAPPGVPSDVPGLEYAGVVAARGASARRFELGARVMGIAGGGGMARHLITDEREAIPVPKRLSLQEAAAIPEVFLTAHDALFSQAELQSGEHVLIHAAASGVGTAAIQLARAAGAIPSGTSRSPGKLDRARKLGLEHGIVPEDGAFAGTFLERNGGRSADVILDAIGAAYFEQNLSVLASRGRLVIIGLMGGTSAELPLGLLLGRRLRIFGTVLRSRSLEEKITVAERFCEEALGWLEQGTIEPVVDAVYPMASAAEAFGRLERNESFGKLVLSW